MARRVRVWSKCAHCKGKKVQVINGTTVTCTGCSGAGGHYDEWTEK